MSDNIVIIGTGLAGYNLAREFRKRDKDAGLTLVTQDDGAFYSKPMLSNGLAKQKRADELAMSDADKMRAELDATILTRTQVTAIDPAKRLLTLDHGEPVSYTKLVLATGADQIIQQFNAQVSGLIYVVNNLDDYRRFRAAIEDKKRVAIIGPGLIGCEFANDLVGAGYEVQVIGPDTAPLGRLLPEPAGRLLQQKLAELGVQWHLQTLVKDVELCDKGVRLSLDNGNVLEADVILSAIGLRPALALAESAGLKTNRGIVVERTLLTSNPHIYALGDCAEVGGLVMPFVMPLMQCARALAATLSGEVTEVKYPAMPVVVKTPAHPVVISPPAVGAQGEWQIEETNDGVKALFRQKDDLLGFALTGSFVSEKQALTKLLPSVLD